MPLMHLLDAGNTEFARSVTRTGVHWKSGRLEKVEAALLDCQTNPASGIRLGYLYERLYRWIEENPEEFTHRGRLAARLAYLIELRAAELGISVLHHAVEFRRVTQRWQPSLWTPLRNLQDAINAHTDIWSGIRVTDLPDGHGGYNYTDQNAFATQDDQAAIRALPEGPDSTEKQHEYFLRLGRRVLTPQSDGSCYARCFGCAAAVLYTLIMDPNFDEYNIESVCESNVGHHFVLIGRSNFNGRDGTDLTGEGRAQWKWTGVVIDVWESNMTHRDCANLAYQNGYAMGQLQWKCAYTKSARGRDRVFATGLQQPARGDAAQVLAAVHAAREQGHPGPARQYVRSPSGHWT